MAVRRRLRSEKSAAAPDIPLDFRTLIEKLPVVSYMVDFREPKTVTYVSPQVETVLGFTPEEYRRNARIWPERIDDRDRATVLEALDRIRRTGAPLACDYRFAHKDGRVVWIHDEATAVRDASGRPRAMQGIMQDITVLREVEKSYREAIENAVEGVFRTTPDGRWLMANRALARLLGYDTPETLMRERPDLLRHHYVHAEDRARFIRLLETQGLVQGFEYEAYHRDGSTLWLRDYARVVLGEDGGTYYEGTVQDVTNRRRAEGLLDQRTRQQAAVARLGQAALAHTALIPLFECAVALVAETLDVALSAIFEGRADGSFIMRAGVGWRADLIGSQWVPDPQAQAWQAFTTRRPIIVNDWNTETVYRPAPYLLEHRAHGGVVVVIGTPEHPYGVLGAHSQSARSFTVDDVNFLQGIASILAAAVVRRRGDEIRDHLLARAVSAHEEERTRIARELHDETGQALSAILIGLRSVQEVSDLSQARSICDRLRDLTAQTIRDVGHIARGLRPSTLDDLGLVPALRRYAEDLSATRGLHIAITDHGTTRFGTEIETTLYRIIQEALTNVARHAHAASAQVDIDHTNGVVRATIRDDGKGFDVVSALRRDGGERALGLVGMQERASLLGGRVAIASRPSGGAQIVVELPVPEGA